MAKKGARPKSSTSTRAATPASAGPIRALPWREDPRRFLYAGFDLLFTIGFVYAFTSLIHNRFGWAQGLLYILPSATVLMMVGTLVAGRAGWWMTVAGGAAMLVWTVGMIVLLLYTASYLSGVYGAFGKAAAMSTVLSTAFIVQFAATLPVLQLKWAMTRAGRRAFGLAPLWPRPGVARA